MTAPVPSSTSVASAQTAVTRAPAPPFRVLKLLARGGMAEIFLAERCGPGGFRRRCVVKRARRETRQDPRTRNLIVQEARILALFHHDLVVGVQDLLAWQGHHLLAMDYVPGPTLGRLVRRHGSLAPGLVSSIGRQACEALAHVHEASTEDGRGLALVHRDVKPDNFILTPSGRLKLIDFGVAESASRDAGPETRIVRGTPAFIAPEQIIDGLVIPAGDVYSLGATLYELLTGQRPFRGNDSREIIAKVARRERPFHPRRLLGSAAHGLSDIIWKALAPDPGRRFRSARALGSALSDWETRTGLGANHGALGSLAAAVPMSTGSARPASSPLSVSETPTVAERVAAA